MAGRAARRDEQRGRAHRDRLVGHRRGARRSRRAARSRWAAGGGRPSRTRPSRGCARGRRRSASSRSPPCSQSWSRPVVERVEHELAREPEQVERAGTVLGDERAGRREVLAAHDLLGLDGAVLVATRAWRRSRSKAASRSRQLLGRVAGLAQLVAARVASAARSGPAAPGRRGRAATSGVSMMCASASCTTRPLMYGNGLSPRCVTSRAPPYEWRMALSSASFGCSGSSVSGAASSATVGPTFAASGASASRSKS